MSQVNSSKNNGNKPPQFKTTDMLVNWLESHHIPFNSATLANGSKNFSYYPSSNNSKILKLKFNSGETSALLYQIGGLNGKQVTIFLEQLKTTATKEGFDQQLVKLYNRH